MPPRRSKRVAELQQPQARLGPLEGDFARDVVGRVLSTLPLDERLRAREVSRGWRFLLKDASFWTHVDLGESCGVNPRYLASEYFALPLLRAACARAKGSLQSMDLSGVDEQINYEADPLVLQWLDSASTADKASLRDLVAPTPRLHTDEQMTAICRTLPLCRVRCGVVCNTVDAPPLLRREPPHELLTINALLIFQNRGGDDEAVLDLAAALTGYKGMEQLNISGVLLDTRATVDALVDAAISAGIKDVSLIVCGLSQTALPALTRLLQSPGFVRLAVIGLGEAMFDGPALFAFCEALHNCTCLRTLHLKKVYRWDEAAFQLIAAMEGLPSLQELSMHGNYMLAYGTPAMRRAAGECLARLIARSSSLRVLNLLGNALGEIGMAPIFEALRSNSSLAHVHLQEPISAEFARNMVLPAVRANTRLRKLEGLHLVGAWEEAAQLDPSLREVEDILAARRQVDVDA